MNLITTLVELDESEELHMARLLVLLQVFGGRERNAIEGLTKLAKLDFLLRYPLYLVRALKARRVDSSEVEIVRHEETSIESEMIRFRYGPWDPRHKRIINLLAAKGLAEVKETPPVSTKSKQTHVQIQLTKKGYQTAISVSETKGYQILVKRAVLLKRYFNLSGGWLKRFIYRTFPEIVSLRIGEVIS